MLSFAKTLAATAFANTLLLGALFGQAHAVAGDTTNQPKLYSLVLGDSLEEISLIDALKDISRTFSLPSDGSQDLDFPEGFYFPRSFEYSMNLGTVTQELTDRPQKQKVYEGH